MNVIVAQHVQTFCDELRQASSTAREEATLLGSSSADSTVLHVFLEELSALVERLETNLKQTSDSTVVTDAELALAKHVVEDTTQENDFLKNALRSEEVRIRELLWRLGNREQIFAELKTHVLRQETHRAAGLGATYAAVPFELVEALDAETYRTQQRAEAKVATVTKNFEVTMRKQRDGYEKRLEAKDREIVQMQMRYRDSLRGLQDAHAQELSRLAEDRRELRVLLTDTEQLAMQRAEAFCSAAFDERLAATKKEFGDLMAKLTTEKEDLETKLSDALERLAASNQERDQLNQTAVYLQQSLRHVMEVELPARIALASHQTDNEVDQLKEMQAGAASRVVQLEVELSDLKVSVANQKQQLDAEVQALTQQLQASRNEAAQRETAMREALAARAQLNSQLQNALKLELQLQTEVEFLRRATGASAAESFKKLLEQAEAAHDTQMVELQDELHTTQERLALALDEKIELEEKIRLSEASYRACDVERVDFRQRHNKLELRLQEMKQQYDSVQEKLQQVQKTLTLERNNNGAPTSATTSGSRTGGASTSSLQRAKSIRVQPRKSFNVEDLGPQSAGENAQTPRSTLKRFASVVRKSATSPNHAAAGQQQLNIPSSPNASRDTRDTAEPSFASFATIVDVASRRPSVSLLDVPTTSGGLGSSGAREGNSMVVDAFTLSALEAIPTVEISAANFSPANSLHNDAVPSGAVRSSGGDASNNFEFVSGLLNAASGGGYIFPTTPGDTVLAIPTTSSSIGKSATSPTNQVVYLHSREGSLLLSPPNAPGGRTTSFNNSPRHVSSGASTVVDGNLVLQDGTNIRASFRIPTAQRHVDVKEAEVQCSIITATPDARIIHGASVPVSVEDRRIHALLRHELAVMHREIAFLEKQIHSLHQQNPILEKADPLADSMEGSISTQTPLWRQCAKRCEAKPLELEPIPFTDITHRKEFVESNARMTLELEARHGLLMELQKQLQKDISVLDAVDAAIGVSQRACSPASQPSAAEMNADRAASAAPRVASRTGAPRMPSPHSGGTNTVLPLTSLAIPPSRDVYSSPRRGSPSRGGFAPSKRVLLSESTISAAIHLNNEATTRDSVSTRSCGAHPPVQRPASARTFSRQTFGQTSSCGMSSGRSTADVDLLDDLRVNVSSVTDPTQYFCVGAAARSAASNEPRRRTHQHPQMNSRWSSAAMSPRLRGGDGANESSAPTVRIVASRTSPR